VPGSVNEISSTPAPITSRHRRICSTIRSGPPQKLIGSTPPTLAGCRTPATFRDVSAAISASFSAPPIGTAPACPARPASPPPRRQFLQDHVGAVDDVVRTRCPTVCLALLAVVSRRRAIPSNDPYDTPDPCGAERRRRPLLRWSQHIGLQPRQPPARPDRNRPILEIPPLPTERLRFGPGLQDQFHTLISAARASEAFRS